MLCEWGWGNSMLGRENRLAYQWREILMVGPRALRNSGHWHNNGSCSVRIRSLILQVMPLDETWVNTFGGSEATNEVVEYSK